MNVENLGPVAPGSVIVVSIPGWEHLDGDEPEAWYRTLGEQFGHTRFALVVVVPPTGLRVLAAEEDLRRLVAGILAAGGEIPVLIFERPGGIPGAGGFDAVEPPG